MIERNLGDPDNNDDRNKFIIRNVPAGLKALALLLGILDLGYENPQPADDDPKQDSKVSAPSSPVIVDGDNEKETNPFNLPLPK